MSGGPVGDQEEIGFGIVHQIPQRDVSPVSDDIGEADSLRRTPRPVGRLNDEKALQLDVPETETQFMTGRELAPLELAGRLALALGLAVFLGLAFEEVYKRDERSTPGGVRTFPVLALSGAMLYLIEPGQALAFIAGLIALAVWLHPFLRPADPNAT
ncbi:MAG: hypothetical protein ACXVCF_22500, partial [Isosphaeraceae bacterium]